MKDELAKRAGAPKMPTSVNIEKAKNGFLVSCYRDDGKGMGKTEKVIAKDMGDVMTAVGNMMGEPDNKKVEELKGKYKT
jgi:hypothetical protein